MPLEQVRETYDVVVVGGGPAGLSAAVALARSRRSVLVVDAGEPRNAAAGHAHNLLGREGVVPAHLLADGRAEAVAYGAEVLTGRVTSVRPAHRYEQAAGEEQSGPVADVGFVVSVQDGPAVAARRLLVTTGLADELPAVPGLAERWGRDVLHCAYCHGWEVRDQAIGVLAGSAGGLHQAQMFRQLSASVTLFTHTGPTLTADQTEQLAARGITVVAGDVVEVVVRDDQLRGVRLDSGEVVPLQALVVAPFFAANAELLITDLGLPVAEMRMNETVVATHIAADPSGATAVPGVWVAGNVANPTAQLMASAAAGLTAGAAINADLIAEDTRAAVTAHRAALGDRHEESPQRG